jgi:hypothetical protein
LDIKELNNDVTVVHCDNTAIDQAFDVVLMEVKLSIIMG